MSIVSYEIQQQNATNMLHNIDTHLIKLSQMKNSLLTEVQQNLEAQSSLEPNSPEMQVLEKKRLALAALEKKIDTEIQQYQNKRQKVEELLNNCEQKVKQNIARFYAGGSQ